MADRSSRSLMYWALRAAFAASPRIPLSWRYALGALVGEAAYWCWPSKRRNTGRNMAVITGDWRGGGISPRAKAMARASLRNYGRYMIDFLNLPNVPSEEIVRRVDVQGWEHLDRAVEAGKGTIFVTGHVGLWDYAAIIVASRYPGRVHVVAESFDSPGVDRLIQGQRAAKGMRVIPMTSVRTMVRVLRDNGIIAVLVDRPVHGDGVPVEFFGRPTTVPAGVATLAALTGAALLPGYLIHHDDGTWEGCIMPPVERSTSGDRAADVRRMTQGSFNALQRIIMRSPRHWYMFRDMWGPAVAVSEQAEAVG